jgi:hypothetical protein
VHGGRTISVLRIFVFNVFLTDSDFTSSFVIIIPKVVSGVDISYTHVVLALLYIFIACSTQNTDIYIFTL